MALAQQPVAMTRVREGLENRMASVHPEKQERTREAHGMFMEVLDARYRKDNKALKNATEKIRKRSDEDSEFKAVWTGLIEHAKDIDSFMKSLPPRAEGIETEERSVKKSELAAMVRHLEKNV